MELELTTSGAKIEKSALNRPKWLPDGSRDPFTQNPPKIFINFGVSSGTPKSTKNRSLAPKGAPGSNFLSIFLAITVFLIFGLGFSSILGKNVDKKRRIFSKPRVIFSTWRPPKSMHRRSVLSTFRFFYFVQICDKIAPKAEQNWYPQKTSKNEAQGVPELTKNGSELIRFYLKISKMGQKYLF